MNHKETKTSLLALRALLVTAAVLLALQVLEEKRIIGIGENLPAAQVETVISPLTGN